MKKVKWIPILYLFLYLSSPAFAQSAASGASGLKKVTAQNNVTVVYDATSGQPLMMVIDAVNLNDPAFNPPNSVQVAIPPATYNAMNPVDLQTFIAASAPVVSVSQ